MGTVVRARRRRLHRPPRRRPAARAGQGRGHQGARRSARGSTSPRAPPTPTPSTTCRCSRWSATPCAINPDSRLRAHARAQGWRIRDYRTGRKAARAGLLARSGRRRSRRRRRRRHRPEGPRRTRSGCVTHRYRRVPSSPTATYRGRCCTPGGEPHAERSHDSRARARMRSDARSLLALRAGSCSPAGGRLLLHDRGDGLEASRPARTSGPAPAAASRRRGPAASSEDDEGDRDAADRPGRAGPRRRQGGLRAALRPLPRSVYRFLFYRTRSQALAEDLTSETFFRALRSMNNFRWQGRDFGAWLMTIARNLATDHFKAGRTRLELTTEDMCRTTTPPRARSRRCWPPDQRGAARGPHGAARPSSATA